MKLLGLSFLLVLVLSTVDAIFAQDINYGGISISIGAAVPKRPSRTDIYYELILESQLRRYDLIDDYLFIRPIFGVIDSELHTYVYSGLDFSFIGDQITFSASFSMGHYTRKKSSPINFDLGFPLEFREDIHFSWNVSDKWLVKAGIYHLSNAGLGNINPGLEVIYFGMEFH